MKFYLLWLQESIPELFHYDSMKSTMQACAEPHINMNYMHSPDYEVQKSFIKRYMETVDAPAKERSLTLLLSVGYWVWTPDVPQVSAHQPYLADPPPHPCATQDHDLNPVWHIYGTLNFAGGWSIKVGVLWCRSTWIT